MDDFIKRADAIEYLVDNMTWYDADGCESDEDEKRFVIEELVNGIPSTQIDHPDCESCDKAISHVIGNMSKRIHELEQVLRDYEKGDDDDGK